LWAVACTRTLLLGTECPELAAECITTPAPADAGEEDVDAEAEPPDQTGLDAGPGSLDAALSDTGTSTPNVPAPIDADTALPDAGADDATPPLVSLALANPEFERNPGVPAGDVVLANNVLDPIIGVVISDLPSWYACWVGSVNSVTWDLDQNVGTPLYKGDYISLVLNSIFNNKIEPARQKLSAPMRVGATYALELDVLGLPDNGAQLYVEVRGHDSDCGDGTLLARSATLPERSWTPLCLTFSPERAFSHFSIGTGYAGPQPSTNARVRLDTLRQRPSCPAR
jgi:hypothetical protein